MKVCEQADQRA